MSNELMDYAAQPNFDFFKYRYELSSERKQRFMHDCKRVIEGAQATVTEMLKLGCSLARLKASGEWKEVVNPENGMSFNYSSFESFSAYAFGFGKTRTSNLLSVSEFVEYDERTDTLTFKNTRYIGMSTSKLIEIAPIPDYQREYFTSDMTVKEIRLCKKYMEESDTFYEDRRKADFDIRAYAKSWDERKNCEEGMRTAKAVDDSLRAASFALGVDPDVAAFYQNYYEPSVPTSELMEEVEENSDVGIFVEPQEETARKELDFSTREKIRKFLSGYDKWDTLHGGKFFDELKRYTFKNGTELFAANAKMQYAKSGTEKKILFYFLSLGYGTQPVKISKVGLEVWLKANEGVLI